MLSCATSHSLDIYFLRGYGIIAGFSFSHRVDMRPVRYLGAYNSFFVVYLSTTLKMCRKRASH